MLQGKCDHGASNAGGTLPESIGFVESQEYSDVGQAEVEAGIAVAKEVLKAVFQYSTLVNQLKALKKGP